MKGDDTTYGYTEKFLVPTQCNHIQIADFTPKSGFLNNYCFHNLLPRNIRLHAIFGKLFCFILMEIAFTTSMQLTILSDITVLVYDKILQAIFINGY